MLFIFWFQINGESFRIFYSVSFALQSAITRSVIAGYSIFCTLVLNIECRILAGTSTGTLTSLQLLLSLQQEFAVAGADDVAVAVTADSSVLFCFFLSILLFIIITPFFKLYNIYYITFIWRSQNGIYHRYFAENEKGLRIMVRYEYNEYRVIGV